MVAKKMSPLDFAPSSTLDGVLGIPEHLRDSEKYAGMYDDMTMRLRDESNGLPMNTLMEVLIERISATYVTIRWREDTNSWNGVAQQKELNNYWLDLTKEFNRLLREGDETLRDAMLIQMHDVVISGIKLIEDPETRRTLQRHYTEEFAKMGL